MALNNREISNKVRVYHRYLGFFLTGIMFMYALSGITLTFRDKEYFKGCKRNMSLRAVNPSKIATRYTLSR